MQSNVVLLDLIISLSVAGFVAGVAAGLAAVALGRTFTGRLPFNFRFTSS